MLQSRRYQHTNRATNDKYPLIDRTISPVSHRMNQASAADTITLSTHQSTVRMASIPSTLEYIRRRKPNPLLRRLSCRNPCRDPQLYSTSVPDRDAKSQIPEADDNNGCQMPRSLYTETDSYRKGNKERRTKDKEHWRREPDGASKL